MEESDEYNNTEDDNSNNNNAKKVTLIADSEMIRFRAIRYIYSVIEDIALMNSNEVTDRFYLVAVQFQAIIGNSSSSPSLWFLLLLLLTRFLLIHIIRYYPLPQSVSRADRKYTSMIVEDTKTKEKAPSRAPPSYTSMDEIESLKFMVKSSESSPSISSSNPKKQIKKVQTEASIGSSSSASNSPSITVGGPRYSDYISLVLYLSSLYINI